MFGVYDEKPLPPEGGVLSGSAVQPAVGDRSALPEGAALGKMFFWENGTLGSVRETEIWRAAGNGLQRPDLQVRPFWVPGSSVGANGENTV